MAEISTIARPYAKAAFLYARETDSLAKWSGMLSLIATAVADTRMSAYLARPQLTGAKQAEALVSVCGDRLDAAGRNFLRQLCQNRRIFAVGAVRDQFERMLAELNRVGEVSVLSAFPMDDAEAAKITATLKRRFDQDIRVSVDVDPALMGGIVVRFGDVVIDASVRGRLEKLASTLNS